MKINKDALLFVIVLVVIAIAGVSRIPSSQLSPLDFTLENISEQSDQTAPERVAQLQAIINRVAQAAANDQWGTASTEVDRLQDFWHANKPGDQQLTIVQQIDNHIQNLHYNVWGRDKAGVLNTTRELTEQLAQLQERHE